MLYWCYNNGSDMWGCLRVSRPSLSAQTSQEPVSVFYSELLLGNAEEFGVWPWTGSLCANHYFATTRGSRRLHADTYHGDIFQHNTGTHTMLLNTIRDKTTKTTPTPPTPKTTTNKQTNSNNKLIKSNNGKIALFGQGQPVHFDFLFSLVPR